MLPRGLPEEVVNYINEMTFAGGFMKEQREVWSKSPEIRLFKLYDKVNNSMDGSWMSVEKSQVYKEFTLQLAADVEEHFGLLNIVHVARSLNNS